jgi:hypothetical protein
MRPFGGLFVFILPYFLQTYNKMLAKTPKILYDRENRQKIYGSQVYRVFPKKGAFIV